MEVELGFGQRDQVSHRPMVASVAWERRVGSSFADRSWAALMALLAAGCHSGDDPATPSAAPGPYTRADVDAIVLGPDDAPDGTAYVDGGSGFQDLQAFARDATERAHLVEDGFQVGHLALFFPAGHANGGAPEPLTNRSTIVQGITGLFRDPAGAERSLERYEQDLRTRQLPDARDVPADGLGETSFGLRSEHPTVPVCRSTCGASAT